MNTEEQELYGDIDKMFEDSSDISIGSQGVVQGAGAVDPDLYTVSLNNNDKIPKDKNGSPFYNSLVRFVMNPKLHNGNFLHRITKYVYYMKASGATDNSPIWLDCPSTIGTNKNLMSATFFYLKNLGSKHYSNIAYSDFSRKLYNWAIIYIVKDGNFPDLDNTFKVFRFPNTINDMIDTEAAGNEQFQQPPVNVFHPFYGKNLLLDFRSKKIKNDDGHERTVSTYEGSKFDGTVSMIPIPGLDYQVYPVIGNGLYSKDPIENEKFKEHNKVVQRKLGKYIHDNVPDLSKYCYKGWDDSTEEMIIAYIQERISDTKVYKGLLRHFYRSRLFIRKYTSIENVFEMSDKIQSDYGGVDDIGDEDNDTAAKRPVHDDEDIKDFKASLESTGDDDLPDLPFGDMDDETPNKQENTQNQQNNPKPSQNSPNKTNPNPSQNSSENDEDFDIGSDIDWSSVG